jgi:hypothetical protein
MSRAFTEQENDYWFQLETRQLPMPDGTELAFTDTRVLWNAYDFLQERGELTTLRMVELAINERDKRNLPFEVTFPRVVSLRYDLALETAEARIRIIDEALLKAKIALERSFKSAALPA